MRKTTLTVAATLALVALVAGTAWAATVQCPAGGTYDSPGLCEATQGDDAVLGSPDADEMYAFAGDDVVRGRGGRDYIQGGDGDDRVFGGRGRDVITDSDPGEDDSGNDEKRGGPGDDRVYGHEGDERLFGGGGDDEIHSYLRGGLPDVVRCGPGRDTVYYRAGVDEVAGDCEVRIEGPAPDPGA